MFLIESGVVAGAVSIMHEGLASTSARRCKSSCLVTVASYCHFLKLIDDSVEPAHQQSIKH